MKSFIFLIPFTLFVLLINSCTNQFTNSTRIKIEENQISMQSVQFYTSGKIVLKRIERDNERLNTNKRGKLRIRNGKMIEKIKFPRRTPAVCLNSSDSLLQLSFEKDNQATLSFRRVEDIYMLDYEATEKPQVSYKGERYEIIKGYDSEIRIKKSDDFNTKKNRKRVKGIKLVQR